MGDADEVTGQLKNTDGGITPSTSKKSPDLDVVNLSSQMINMDILPGTSDNPTPRQGLKRVRFSLPEPKIDTRRKICKSARYRRQDIGEFRIAKARRRLDIGEFRIAKARRRPSLERICKMVNRVRRESQCTNAQRAACKSDEDPCSSETEECVCVYVLPKRRKPKKNTNRNSNCAPRSKCNGPDNCWSYINGKSKSDECLTRKPEKKGKKKVVSKKTNVKEDIWRSQHVLGDKRKVSECLQGLETSNSKDGKRRKTTSDVANGNYNAKVTSSSSRSLNAKRAAEGLRKAKEAKAAKKRREMKKKLIQKQKDALKRKEILKKKLAQKRKANKKIMKEKAKIQKQKKKKVRKIKIIPIKREEETSESLLINLLKFLTFETAFAENYECCDNYCWDKWKDLDMDDVLYDFD